MTDMASGLGATASCPACAAQVQVTEVPGDAVTCPKCGASMPAGARDETMTDVTMVEVVRAFETMGHDADVTADGGGLRCSACGASTAAEEWAVEGLRRGSTPVAGDLPEQVAAAVTCPACGTPGIVTLGDDDPALAVLARARPVE